MEQRFVEMVATEAAASPDQVRAAVELLDRGLTASFIAAYRRDATGGLDAERLELIERRNQQFITLTSRRDAMRANIAAANRLTDSLAAALDACSDALTLEDLCLPFRKRKNTKASVAALRGLEPLADFIMMQVPHPGPVPFMAEQHISAEHHVLTAEEALEGARDILSERITFDAGVRRMVRDALRDQGVLAVSATKYMGAQRQRFEPFFTHRKPLRETAPADLLTILRGLKIGALRTELLVDEDALEAAIVAKYLKDPESSFAPEITAAVRDAFRRVLRVEMEEQVFAAAQQAADDAVIADLRRQVETALMTQPAGPVRLLAVHPMRGGGTAFAAVDEAGACLEARTDAAEAAAEGDAAPKTVDVAAELLEKHRIRLVVVGNSGPARRAGRALQEALRATRIRGVHVIHAPEAGISAWAASAEAAAECPNLAEPLRAALTLARRGQDPLMEMIKLEPRHLAVGPHVREVNQRRLQEALFRTVEYCVCRIGLEVNTAPVHALRHVTGLQMGSAQNVLRRRETEGPFTNRAQLKDVSGIGEKSCLLCAGFLRITGGEQPLDATRIHPEAHEAVTAALAAAGLSAASLPLADTAAVAFAESENPAFGPLAAADWRRELAAPWEDPRGRYVMPEPRPRPERTRPERPRVDLSSIQEGAIVEGKVTNIAEFGVFVDIGVGKEGLIHLSELSDRFVEDAKSVVEVGQTVKAMVTRVDPEGRRISLSIRATLPPREPAPDDPGRRGPADDRPRGPRDAGERGRRPEGRGPRPERGDDRRRDRGDERRPHDRSGDRSAPRDRREPAGGDNPLMNTLLADQLAALRDKLLSD